MFNFRIVVNEVFLENGVRFPLQTGHKLPNIQYNNYTCNYKKIIFEIPTCESISSCSILSLGIRECKIGYLFI